MVLLPLVPVFVLVAAIHRVLQLYAPSNVLIARARITPSRFRNALLLVALALVLVVLAHGTVIAIAAGAAGWLNLVAPVLFWDAIKLMLVALLVMARTGVTLLRSAGRRIVQQNPS